MTEVLTTAQMRAAEAQAMASGTTGAALMERAGAGVVEAILTHSPELAERAHHAVVLCGPGNNGGDGFVVARLLAERGWRVETFLYGDAAGLPGDARAMHDRWAAMGEVRPMGEAGGGARPDLLVDAVFGIGLSRPIPDSVTEALAAVHGRGGTARLRSVAIDCPSGFDVDRGQFSGALPDRALTPDLCVTFHRPKPGHLLDEASGRALEVVDIGIGPAFRADASALSDAPKTPGALRVVSPEVSLSAGDWYRRVTGLRNGGHKYQRGHVLVLSGRTGQGGAARLAARAALRVGAGLVTVGAPPAAIAEHAARLDAIMLTPVIESLDVRRMLSDDRLRCLVLGPGLGVRRAAEMVPAALWGKRACVLDADARTAFADEPQHLFNHLHDKAILTPHEGEFRRLFPDIAEAMPATGRIEAARAAAARAGCTVLLKGPATVIARPDGCASIHPALRDRAMPWLATAGAGDVLAGLIGGLMATMPTDALDVLGAAELGAWLHVEAARAHGPGLIAEDLPERIPGVLRRMMGG